MAPREAVIASLWAREGVEGDVVAALIDGAREEAEVIRHDAAEEALHLGLEAAVKRDGHWSGSLRCRRRGRRCLGCEYLKGGDLVKAADPFQLVIEIVAALDVVDAL